MGVIKMKACLAILADYKLHNYARKIAFEAHKKYDTGFIAARLPQHITLGPSFEVEDPYEIEEYFNSLSKTVEPFDITAEKIDLMVVGDEADSLGILWMDIKENQKLKELHNKIYNYINEEGYKVDKVPGDGIYHFHSTIILGQHHADIYRNIFNSIENKELNYTFKAKEIALFCPPDHCSKMGTYITLKVLPLGV